MLSCKDVTRLISQSLDRSLPMGKRIGVRLHILMRRFCARYERQLLAIRDAARRLSAPSTEPGDPSGGKLSPESREHIRKILANR